MNQEIKIKKMKTLFKTIFALTVLIGCKEKQTVEINTPEEIRNETKTIPDIADVEFSDGMIGKVWHNYLEIKMALTESDADQVEQTAGSMAESFSDELPVLNALATQMSETDDIEVQRELFSQLTEEIGPLFEEALSGGTIYKKLCPMAFDGEGAHWYADIKEISNPYFGDKMPDCGSIEKTISKE